MESPTRTRSESVLIVGGGASAVFVTAALLDRAAATGLPRPRITVVGHEPEVGRGLAYGRADAHHRLNSPAGKMSLSPTDDAAFLCYLAEVGWRDVDGSEAGPGTFVPRVVFGDYVAREFAALSEVVPSANQDSAVRFVQGDVSDLRLAAVSLFADTNDADAPAADAAPVVATLADGTRIGADRVVLALGNPAPGRLAMNARRSVDDPWAPGALDGISAADRVLLVGTGLTMIDVATSLTRREPGIRLTATSRRLLVPAEHLSSPAAPGPGLGDDVSTLGGMISLFGRQLRAAKAAGTPWQAVIDGMRPQTQDLWLRLSPADRKRFLRHAARRWDVHRHRMAPSVHAEFTGLLDDGTLILRADAAASGEYDVAVNCTGPESVAARGWNPLVDRLLDAGVVVPDATGTGVDADRSGALVGADGEVSTRVFTIGGALRGALWETVAVGEIRLMAGRIADAILEPAPVRV